MTSAFVLKVREGEALRDIPPTFFNSNTMPYIIDLLALVIAVSCAGLSFILIIQSIAHKNQIRDNETVYRNTSGTH